MDSFESCLRWASIFLDLVWISILVWVDSVLTPWPAQICWRCRASKGLANRQLVYTDVSEEALWRLAGEADSEPWDVQPSMASIWGWDAGLSMVSIDILHILHLGVLRDLCASALKVLVKARGYYAASTITKRLHVVTREVKEFARAEKLNFQIRRIKKSTLDWKSDKCPELHCKGADCAVILRYLVQKTQSKRPPRYGGMTVALWAAQQFLATLLAAGLFLDPAEKNTAFTCGELFITSYMKLATQAVHAREYLWKSRPKIHYLCHVTRDILEGCRNPAKYGTWMDEDHMRATFHMRKKMASKTAPLNVLRRYSVVAKTAMDHHRGT